MSKKESRQSKEKYTFAEKGGVLLLVGLILIVTSAFMAFSDWSFLLTAGVPGIVVAAIGFIKFRKTQAKIHEAKDNNVETRVNIPLFVNDEIRLHLYRGIEFTPINKGKNMCRASAELLLSMLDDKIAISYKNITIGYLNEKIDMVSDWLKNGDTVKIWLESINETKGLATMAFYRDEQKRLSYRENQIVKLQKYRNKDIQMELSILELEKSIGIKLTIENEWDNNGNDIVWIYGENALGILPKKIAERYMDEGIEAVFLDRIDYDEENNVYIPYVKIYW